MRSARIQRGWPPPQLPRRRGRRRARRRRARRLDAQLQGPLDRSLRDRATEVARLAASTPDLLLTPATLEGGSAAARCSCRSSIRAGGSSPARARSAAACCPAPVAARRCDDRRAGYGDARLGTSPARVRGPARRAGAGPAAGGAVIVAGTPPRSSRRSTPRAARAGRRRRRGPARGGARTCSPAAPCSRSPGCPPPLAPSSPRRPVAASAPPARTRRAGTLADTLNAMLAALERAREREQRFVADASHELRTPLTALRGNRATYPPRRRPRGAGRHRGDAARLGRPARRPARARAGGRRGTGARGAESTSPRSRGTRRPTTPAPDAPGRPRRAAGARGRWRTSSSTRAAPAGGAHHVSVQGDGNGARLSVSDEGPGLAPEEARQAFERFWRGEDADVRGLGPRPRDGARDGRAPRRRRDRGRPRFTIDLPASHGALKPRP